MCGFECPFQGRTFLKWATELHYEKDTTQDPTSFKSVVMTCSFFVQPPLPPSCTPTFVGFWPHPLMLKLQTHLRLWPVSANTRSSHQPLPTHQRLVRQMEPSPRPQVPTWLVSLAWPDSSPYPLSRPPPFIIAYVYLLALLKNLHNENE